MSGMTWLERLMNTVADRGRELLGLREDAEQGLPDLCRRLVAGRGEATNIALAREIGVDMLGLSFVSRAEEIERIRELSGDLVLVAKIERRVAVETWNEDPVLQSAGRSLLEAAGFYRSYPEMVWERPL